MRYRSQQVAYWYFAAAMTLFGLQIAFAGGPFRKGTRDIPMRRLERLSDVRVQIDGAPASPGRDFPGTFSISGPTDGSSDGDVRIEWWFAPATNARRRGTRTTSSARGSLRNLRAALSSYYLGHSALGQRAIPLNASFWQTLGSMKRDNNPRPPAPTWPPAAAAPP